MNRVVKYMWMIVFTAQAIIYAALAQSAQDASRAVAAIVIALICACVVVIISTLEESK